ncbi:hypothetical protein [Micromonospora cabrerizensis]|uniref:hypothetical protein n=1 Tax=Micromonospora TaxID=1873 RepID=UPI001EE9927B|nr:hypothetical protein [Micromonospora cabrerizensis]MCG5471369.1 hypothetical protein [Micromonospora cabrerizensis]WTE87570.1 hypothetical protein OHA01_02280 [Micromonospora zamorensis]
MLHEQGEIAVSASKGPEDGQVGAGPYDHYNLIARGLPLPRLARTLKPQAVHCAVTSVDVSGRLADRRPLQALGWFAGRPVDLVARDNVITVTARRGGRWTINRQGHLVLPSSVRRSCGVERGHRLLVLAYLDRSVLLVYTMSALELMVSRYGVREAA